MAQRHRYVPLRLGLRFRQDNRVYDMNDAVAGADVCLHYGGVIDPDAAVSDRDRHVRSIDSRCTIKLYDVRRFDFAGDDMVGEYRDQLITIFRLE